MRRLRFYPVILAILCASCSKNVITPTEESAQEGTLTLELTAQQKEPASKASVTETDGPDINEFRVAIYKKENQMRLYNDSYANTVGRTIKLNAGEYRLVAQHGDSLGYGFNKPYYLADPTFTIAKGANTLTAVAKLANVKLAVNFDSSIRDFYSDYYAVVKHNRYQGKSVKFTKSETRNGYLPAGELVLEVYAIVSGEWKYYKMDPVEYKPNDFVTFNITTNNQEGNLAISIITESSVDKKEENVEIPSIALPQDAPSINLSGFEQEGHIHSFVEGASVQGHNAMANFIAKASIKNCYLTIDSDYLEAKGISGKIDFANLTSEAAIDLKNAGFAWDESMLASRTFSFIDFTGVVKKMMEEIKAATEDVTVGAFTIEVIDAVGKKTSESFSIKSLGVKLVLDANAGNVWARKLETSSVSVTNGVPSLVGLQCSPDGVAWFDSEVSSTASNGIVTFGPLTLVPSTDYWVRAVYNHGKNVSNVVKIHTEDALQVGNSGFEDYQAVEYSFKQQGSSTKTQLWYLPYKAGETDPWWACNSKKSMPSSITGLTPTWCKCFPTSGYVKDCFKGSKAALIFTTDIGGSNTSGTLGPGTHEEHEGELWIGTADDKGNHVSDGHAFASRPSKLSFMYKYAPKNSEKFMVESWIKDAEGQVIATANENAGPAADSWTKHTLDYNYTVRNKKAASIYIMFRSCYGEGEVSIGVKFDLGEGTVEAHAGSMLKIDEVELIYE